MKIGIDAHGVGGHSLALGNETYFKNLIVNLLVLDGENDYHVFVNHPEAMAEDVRPFPNVKLVALYPKSQWLQRPVSLPVYARRHRLDIVHVPFVLPLFTSAKTVLTVHDVNYEVFPKDFTFVERWRMSTLVPPSCRHADLIFAVSEWSREQLHELYRVPYSKIVVTPNAADHLQRRSAGTTDVARLQLPAKFIFFAGMIQPKKNLARLVQAFDLLKLRTELPHHLVLAGPWGWRNAELEAALAGMRHRESVHLPGYLTPAELETVMPLADVFAFPSLYESFGIPPMEAQRFGVPALVSNTTCFPEVYRDTAIYCDPNSVESIATALERMLLEPGLRDILNARVPENMRRYTWRKTAEIALDSFLRLGGSHKGALKSGGAA
jgi:glycosyltransferase involved in cell wall biosynthesis